MTAMLQMPLEEVRGSLMKRPWMLFVSRSILRWNHNSLAQWPSPHSDMLLFNCTQEATAERKAFLYLPTNIFSSCTIKFSLWISVLCSDAYTLALALHTLYPHLVSCFPYPKQLKNGTGEGLFSRLYRWWTEAQINYTTSLWLFWKSVTEPGLGPNFLVSLCQTATTVWPFSLKVHICRVLGSEEWPPYLGWPPQRISLIKAYFTEQNRVLIWRHQGIRNNCTTSLCTIPVVNCLCCWLIFHMNESGFSLVPVMVLFC